MREMQGGLSVPVMLTIVFSVLKLTDTVDWSWWWVFSPLWITALIGSVVFAIVIGYVAIKEL